MQIQGPLTFIIGGAEGFSPLLNPYEAEKISLSRLTFTHQITRLILVEQIYRAFTILENLPYHK